MTTKFAYSISAMSLILLSACSGPSSEELKEANEQCAKFYKQQRAKNFHEVKAVDHWTKNGMVVIELAAKEFSWSDSYTSGLCVYDKEKGTIGIPGIFDQGKWSK